MMHLSMSSHGHHDDHGHHDHHDHAAHHAPAKGGNWKGLLLLLLLAGGVGVLVRTVFFVDETEYVYVTQFGEPIYLRAEAGLGVKWPYQSLRRFDRRLHLYEPPPREILTQDKENLNFEWFVCWRIPSDEFLRGASSKTQGDPAAGRSDAGLEKYVKRFLQTVGTIDAAERRLEERIQAAIAAEIGRVRLSQLVSLESKQLVLADIGEHVTSTIRGIAADEFGIEVVDVRLKRFSYPEAVKPAVYAEIRSERERVAVQYRAEGASEKAKIESLADLQRDQLLAQAQREATTIRGQGEAKAIEISNAAHGKNPQFFEFLKTLETYRSILDNQTTVVLSADSPLLKLLTEGLPDRMKQAVPGTARAADTAVPAPPAGSAGGSQPVNE